jgi:hypothetical protein
LTGDLLGKDIIRGSRKARSIIKYQQSRPTCPLFSPCTNSLILTILSEFHIMYSRSATGWSEWEEDNLLPWLEENSDMPWTDRAQAYSEQFGVSRSVESLRGKKDHILRKRRLGRARRKLRTTTSKTRGNPRRLKDTGNSAYSGLSSHDSTNSRTIGQWLQGIPEVASNCTKTQEVPSANLATCGTRIPSLWLGQPLTYPHSPWTILHGLQTARHSLTVQALGFCTLGLR